MTPTDGRVRRALEAAENAKTNATNANNLAQFLRAKVEALEQRNQLQNQTIAVLESTLSVLLSRMEAIEQQLEQNA